MSTTNLASKAIPVVTALFHEYLFSVSIFLAVFPLTNPVHDGEPKAAL
jgi:hypothetical protein